MRIISLLRFFGFLIASLRGARILWLSKRLPQSVCLLAVICGLGCIAAAAEAPAKFKVGEFEFSRPADWEWVDVSSSPMRKAQLKINGPEKSQSAGLRIIRNFGGLA